MTTEEKEKTAEEAEQEGEGQTEEIATEKEEGQEEVQAISSELLLEMTKAGLFYGRGKTKTYPKMRQFILTTRSGIEVINLEKTAVLMEKAVAFLKEVAEKGGKVMLVGTQPAARNAIKELALKFNFPYVADKWVGGTLTNFDIIRKRVEYYIKLKNDKKAGKLEKYTKKERSVLDKEMEKMEFLFEGVREMEKLPEAIFVINTVMHGTAVREAKKVGIPLVVVLNTDANPAGFNYIIPANDSAKPAIEFIINKLDEAFEASKKVSSNL